MAKKPARKKTASRKKKSAKTKPAKRGAPTKSCPKCKKTLHAAKSKCDCGYAFPPKKKKRKKKRRAKVTATSVASVRRSNSALSDKLAESIRVVEKAGGLESAKKTLATLKELEKLN